MSETTARSCSGYCGAALSPGRLSAFLVIEPSGRLLEFCDSNCLRIHYRDEAASVQRRTLDLIARMCVRCAGEVRPPERVCRWCRQEEGR